MADPRSLDRAYLLGEISPPEAERIELEVMSDQAAADRLIDAENDLIDDYLEGALSPIDRQKFETVFMAAPARAEKVRFARDLADRASRRERNDVKWGSWTPLLVAASLLIAVGLWYASRGTPPEQQIATSQPPRTIPANPPTEPTPVPAPARRSVPFVLALTATRSGEVSQVVVPVGTQDLVIQIDVSSEPTMTSFEGRITGTGGKELWKTENPVLTTPDGVLELTVAAPAPGTYELTVTGRTNSGQAKELGSIPFALKRP